MVAVPCNAQETAARELVVSQAKSEYSLVTSIFSDPGGLTAGDITLLPGPAVDGLSSWRAVLPVDHYHPYIVVASAEQVLGLGGFSAPALRELADWLHPEVDDSEAMLTLARQLAVMADRDGAFEVQWPGIVPIDERGRMIVEAWMDAAPRDWPTDSIEMRRDGTWVVVATLLSQLHLSNAQPWSARAYGFVFNARGALLAWSVRRSEYFGSEL